MVPPIKDYIAIGTAFVALSIYIFVICRWWFRYLTDLAARFDILERRRRAARAYLIVLLLIVVPLFSTVLWSIDAAPKPAIFIVLGVTCSIAPTVIWWCRRLPALSALGYGRQKQRR
jgi:hypothetical protein